VLLLVTSIKTNVLHTTFLKSELERHEIYDLAFDLVDDQIQQIELAPEIPITHEEISSLITKVLTPEWLQGNVESALDDFDIWLNAPMGTEISIVLTMAEPKANLLTELDVLIDKKISELESCTSDDKNILCAFAGLGLDDFKAELANFDFDPNDLVNQIPDNLDLANPEFIEDFQKIEEVDKPKVVEHYACSDFCPGPREDYLVNIYEGVDNDEECSKLGGTFESYVGWGETFICIADNVKDEKDIQTQISEIKESLEQSKKYYHLGQQWFWYAWIIYGVLIVLFLIMNATGGWRRVINWLGVIMLCIGIIPATLGLATNFGQDLAMDQIDYGPDFSTKVSDLIPRLINDFTDAIFTLPMITGVILVVLGIAVIIGAHWIPKPKGKVKN
jgi:hypothetical protein